MEEKEVQRYQPLSAFFSPQSSHSVFGRLRLGKSGTGKISTQPMKEPNFPIFCGMN